jgi:polysaccharide biosynthesis/export protein
MRFYLFAAMLATSLPVLHGGESKSVPAVVRPEYVVGPGDNLIISVSGLKDLEQMIRVSNSGRIHMPHVGVLSVADLTAQQIEAKIADRLRTKHLVKDPSVQVRISEYRAHPVYILGEVMQPGQFMMKGDMYLVDLIALTAGINELASPVGYLYRRKASQAADINIVGAPVTEADEAIPINFEQLYDGSKPELNVKLQAGDVFYVPERPEQLFFVAGDVMKPGVFSIKRGEELLVSQAIARAGGPSRTAKLGKGMLVRQDENGREDMPVDFKSILMGSKPDIVVKPNDIIFIPGSGAKTLGYGLLGIIPGLAQGAFVVR